MKVVITIECDNAAFEDAPGAEVSRILADLSERIPDDLNTKAPINLYDANGNHVGSVEVS